jgi:hypothetical protein
MTRNADPTAPLTAEMTKYRHVPPLKTTPAAFAFTGHSFIGSRLALRHYPHQFLLLRLLERLDAISTRNLFDHEILSLDPPPPATALKSLLQNAGACAIW